MKKEYRLAVRSDLGLAGAKDACAFGDKSITRGKNILHFVTDVVDATICIALEKLGDGRPLALRLE